MIEVKRLAEGGPYEFEIVIRDGKSESRHLVTMAQDMSRRLAPGEAAEHCIEAAFRFLLDREPKEAILARFDVSVISRYFPEFERELPRYLARKR